MPRNKTPEKQALKYKLETRVCEEKYKQLSALIAQSKNKDMSSLLRDILHNRKIKIYTYDRSLDMVMEELTRLRSEIRSIGININQVTREFNTYPEIEKKIFFGRIVVSDFIASQAKIDRLLLLVATMAKRWLK